jgi:hypothetical protein
VNFKLGCGQMSDTEFLQAFEECRVAPASFHHADHVRLAWLYVRRYGASEAESLLLAGIRKLAIGAGVPGKFLYTTTVAWVRLVAAANREATTDHKFEEWIAGHAELLDQRLLEKYYSIGKLEGEPARSRWLDPDLAPLP